MDVSAFMESVLCVSGSLSLLSRTQKEMVDRQRMQQHQLAQQHSGNTQAPPMSNSIVGGGPMGAGFHPDNQQVC